MQTISVVLTLDDISTLLAALVITKENMIDEQSVQDSAKTIAIYNESIKEITRMIDKLDSLAPEKTTLSSWIKKLETNIN